jgi:uncharacterized phage protein gp47/JayE
MQTQNLTQLRVQFLAMLQANGFPAITEWAGEPTGTEMTFVSMVCQAISQLAQSGALVDQQIASVAAGRYLQWAKGGWLDLIANQVYALTRNPATSTTFTMTLTAVSGAGPYTLQPGDVWIVGPTGNKYQSTSGGTLNGGTSLEISFQAENPGALYDDDPAHVELELTSSLAGVTLSAGGGDFSIVTNSAGSTGSIQPQRTNSNVGPMPHTFGIQINVAGDVGTATYSLQVDSEPFTFEGLLEALNTLVDGTSIAAINGNSPSFLADDVFVFSTPGTPNYVQGNDVESDPALVARCQGRWPSLSLNVMDGKAILWAVTAYPSATRISVSPDPITPGRFVLTVADSHGGVDQAGIDAIIAYISARLGPGELVGAASAFNTFLSASGNVRVPAGTSAAQLEQLQADVDAEWVAYLATVPIGGTVVPVKLIEILMDAGALDVGDVTPLTVSTVVDSFTTSFNVEPGAVPVRGPILSQSLTWMFG